MQTFIEKKSKMSRSFIGNTQFVWFVGVVEDRFDPEHAGRLRVQACLGHHNPDKNAIATSDLPGLLLYTLTVVYLD